MLPVPVLLLLLAVLAVLSTVVRAADLRCEEVRVPTLKAWFSWDKNARVCYDADAKGPLPLHLWAHADVGGSIMSLAYDRRASFAACTETRKETNTRLTLPPL